MVINPSGLPILKCSQQLVGAAAFGLPSRPAGSPHMAEVATLAPKQPEAFTSRDYSVSLEPSRKRVKVVKARSEEHTSELQSLMRKSYAAFCLKKKTNKKHKNNRTITR